MQKLFASSLLLALVLAACNRPEESDAADSAAEVASTSGDPQSRAQAGGTDRPTPLVPRTDAGVPPQSSRAPAPSTMSGSTPSPSPDRAHAAVNDDLVARQVRQAILADTELKGFDIRVTARGGQVTLSGAVRNNADVDRTMEIAQGVQGVRTVHSALSVKNP